MRADDNLLVKNVQFNGSAEDWFTQPSAVDPRSKWVYIDLFKTLEDFDPEVPVDVVITVRGKVDALCPANEFLHSSAACEFAMHGKYADTQCCPHGATKRQGPPDDCCVDDIEKSPYRMEVLRTNIKDNSTVFDLDIKVVNVTAKDFDAEELAMCDHMTLDYAQIQLCESGGGPGGGGEGGRRQPGGAYTVCEGWGHTYMPYGQGRTDGM